jgi:predicted nucleic acid-binding protein
MTMATAPLLVDTQIVLDNDLFTHWRNNQPYVLRQISDYFSRLKEVPALTSMTMFEALWGVESAVVRKQISEEESARYRGRINQLDRNSTVLPFNGTAAAIAAYSFARLSQSNRNKLWQDLFTTATALAHGYGVATGNKSDFELIARNLPPDFPLLRLGIWKP